MPCSIQHPCVRSDDWRDVKPELQTALTHVLGTMIPRATDGILVICSFRGSLFVAHKTNLPEFKEAPDGSACKHRPRPKSTTSVRPCSTGKTLLIETDSLL